VTAKPPKPPILGVILAGGRARRFGTDKALADLAGMSLLDRVCIRAAAQTDALVISRSAPVKSGIAVTYPALPDGAANEGPLCGVLTGLSYARKEGFTQLMTFPCDSPFFPSDLVSRLFKTLIEEDAAVCTVRCRDAEHHTFSLYDVRCEPYLRAAFEQGLRSLGGVGRIVRKSAIDLSDMIGKSGVDPFFNINTPGDLQQASAWIMGDAGISAGAIIPH
jgi:molybdenum cofactor guanylyltransferase